MMTDHDDIARLLRGWQPPPPHPKAVARVLAVAAVRPAPSWWQLRWLVPASLATAAAMAAMLVLQAPPVSSAARHDAVLEADAMATFFATAEDS